MEGAGELVSWAGLGWATREALWSRVLALNGNAGQGAP